MIQQTKNLFTEGLNLDVHPIAMNNQLLSSALNATMITMNGNELVLQNDMGNGRVESAHLPPGFVPVGMKEFGGIVYVASHNPLTGQSLIGSFPSPERNISTDEIYSGRNLMFSRFSTDDTDLREIKQLSLKLALSNGEESFTVRPGDKFSIDMNETYVSNEYNFDDLFENLIKFTSSKNSSAELSVCTLNSNNQLVKIENLDAKYEYHIDGKDYTSFVRNDKLESNIKYNIYKEKLIGDLYLKLTLNVPSNIEWFVTFGEVTSSNKEYYYIYVKKYNNIKIDSSCITITDSIGREITAVKIEIANRTDLFKNDYDLFQIEVINKTLNSKGDANFNNITITPFFDPVDLLNSNFYIMNSGYLPSLKTSLSIDLTKIGSNAVEFNTFRYYNNTSNNNIIFNYGITSYLTSYTSDSINLCLIEYQDGIFNSEKEFELCNDESYNFEQNYFTIQLSDSSVGYGNILNYQITKDFTTLFKLNKIYIAILLAKYRSYQINEFGDYDYLYFNSKPFLLFTSEIANYLFVSNLKQYIDASNTNNIGTEVVDDFLGIPCEIKYNYTYSKPNETFEGSPYVSEYDENKNILYTKSCGGKLLFTLNPTVNIQLPKGCPFSKYDFTTTCTTEYSGQGGITKSGTKTRIGNYIASKYVKDGDIFNELEISSTGNNNFSGNILTISDNEIYSCAFDSYPIRKQNEIVYGRGLIPYLNSINRNDIFLQTIPYFEKLVKNKDSKIIYSEPSTVIKETTRKVLILHAEITDKIQITRGNIIFKDGSGVTVSQGTDPLVSQCYISVIDSNNKETKFSLTNDSQEKELPSGTYSIYFYSNITETNGVEVEIKSLHIYNITNAIYLDAYHVTRWLSLSTKSDDDGSHKRYTVVDIDITKSSSDIIESYNLSSNSDLDNLHKYIPENDDCINEIFSVKSDFSKNFNYVIKNYKESFEATKPLIGFILSYRDSIDWHRSAFHLGGSDDPETKRLNISIPMLPTEDGNYYPLNEIGYAVCDSDKNSSKLNLITKLINFYSNNGYIVQNNIPHEVSYQYADKDNYIYNPQYDITYSIGLDISPKLEFIDESKFRENSIIELTKFENNIISLLGFKEGTSRWETLNNNTTIKSVKLPEFILLDKETNVILTKIENQNVDFTIKSCDILDEVTTYLSQDGSNSLIFAEINGNLYYSDCDGYPFRENKIYFLIEKNNTKYLCPHDKLRNNQNYMKSEDYPNDCQDTILNLCDRFNDETLKIKRINSFNDKYGIYINKLDNMIGKGNDDYGWDRVGDCARSFRSLSGAINVQLINKPSFSENDGYDSW